MKTKYTNFICSTRLAFVKKKGMSSGGRQLVLEWVTSSSHEFNFFDLRIVRRARAAMVFRNNIDVADHN